MIRFLQDLAATDTLGWAAGMLTVCMFIGAVPYVAALPLLPVVFAVNMARMAMGLPQLDGD